MPILTSIRLDGCTMATRTVPRAVTDDRGNVVRHTDGTPKAIDETQLVFHDPATFTTVVVPFDENGKQELVRLLTGGVIVAPAGAVNGATPS